MATAALSPYLLPDDPDLSRKNFCVFETECDQQPANTTVMDQYTDNPAQTDATILTANFGVFDTCCRQLPVNTTVMDQYTDNPAQTTDTVFTANFGIFDVLNCRKRIPVI